MRPAAASDLPSTVTPSGEHGGVGSIQEER
jgi:hypothetical protein